MIFHMPRDRSPDINETRLVASTSAQILARNTAKAVTQAVALLHRPGDCARQPDVGSGM